MHGYTNTRMHARREHGTGRRSHGSSSWQCLWMQDTALMRRCARGCRATTKTWALRDRDSVNSSRKRLILSSGKSGFYARNTGCAAGILVMSCLKGDAVGASSVDGQTRGLLGLIVWQRNDEEVWTGTNQTHGYVTLMVARELKKRIVRAPT